MAEAKIKTRHKQPAPQPTPPQAAETSRLPAFSPKLVGALADEVARTLMMRLPSMIPMPKPRKQKPKKAKKIDYPVFLDTSAIIDGRIFDVINLGLLNGVIVIPDSILKELKHLADSQDMVKRERGRKGMLYLETLRKGRKMKMHILSEDGVKEVSNKQMQVDDKLIRLTKLHKGKLITCDYNLEKKATIENVFAVNVNALANSLKVIAVPGESLHIKLLHPGKDQTQGVGYLSDGTMIVVEDGSLYVGRSIDVVVSRVIQTVTGRILFAKKI
ncbi:MAG: hypothetical protein QG600_585 [Patescibacteria group bacterium]|jgi:uncharacterized protein YacL|nr:hypothetical protein [Patescibacteria group bacterium]